MGKQRMVIKCGGSTLAALPDRFYQELQQLQQEGQLPLIVHGGGPAISEALEQLQIETEFVQGLRKTTDQVLDVVEMVLAGRINKQIVLRIQQNGGQAVGLSGVDGKLLLAEPVENADLIGHVGQVVEVNQQLIEALEQSGFIPVIAPIGIDEQGQRYNINADTAAGNVASELRCDKLVVVTDVPGILKKVDQELIRLPHVTAQEIEQMIASGEIYGGMIPKVRAAVKCLQGQVKEVVIVNGAEPGVLKRLSQGEEIGTRITKNG